MPYSSNGDLPDSVKGNLPEEAQDIFRAAFNSAFEGSCKDSEDQEACAMKVAWSAVSKVFTKGEGGKWVKSREESSPDISNHTGQNGQDSTGTDQHIRALAIPFKKNQMVTQEDGSLLIKGVPMLAAGTWTDSAVGTPLYYPEKTLSDYATNWHDTTGWSRHLGGVPRDITEKVAEASNLRYENGAITADIIIHGATQKSRDTIELVKRKLISFVSVEHTGREKYNPESRQMEADSLDFHGFAFVNKGACKLCRIQEAPKPAEPVREAEIPKPEEPIQKVDDQMTETKELEAKIEVLTKELAELKAPKAPEVNPLEATVTELRKELEELKKQPAPAVTTQLIEQPKELGEVETFVTFDRKNKIARMA